MKLQLINLFAASIVLAEAKRTERLRTGALEDESEVATDRLLAEAMSLASIEAEPIIPQHGSCSGHCYAKVSYGIKSTIFNTVPCVTDNLCSVASLLLSTNSNCGTLQQLKDACDGLLDPCNPLSFGVDECDGYCVAVEARYNTANCDGYSRRLLREGEESDVREDLPLYEVHKIIKTHEGYGAKLDATFSDVHGLISKESCDALVNHLDASRVKDMTSLANLPVGRTSQMNMDEKHESWTEFPIVGEMDTYSRKVYADQLVRLIGRDETLKILDFFEANFGDVPIDCMYLKRHAKQEGGSKWMTPWHIDDYLTVEILLNDGSGGNVLHLNGDGVHKTEGRAGSAIAHADDIMHGITANTGAKYMLILKHHYKRDDKPVRISREMVDEITGVTA